MVIILSPQAGQYYKQWIIYHWLVRGNLSRPLTTQISRHFSEILCYYYDGPHFWISSLIRDWWMEIWTKQKKMQCYSTGTEKYVQCWLHIIFNIYINKLLLHGDICIISIFPFFIFTNRILYIAASWTEVKIAIEKLQFFFQLWILEIKCRIIFSSSVELKVAAKV